MLNEKKKITGAAREDPSYWLPRLYRGTYRHNGRRRETRGWYVKFQVNGERHAVPLRADDPAQAAEEASRIYRQIKVSGWTRTARVSAGRQHTADAPMNPQQPDFWVPRLVCRKYLSDLRGTQSPEWSVVIEHAGKRQWFPLATIDRDLAATAAAERYRTVLTHGWTQAELLFERELTLGIFWNHNPFACTYTTLITVPANQPSAPAPRDGDPAGTMLFVESDGGVRRALQLGLNHSSTSGIQVATCAPNQLQRIISRFHPPAIFLNRRTDSEPATLQKWLTNQFPETPVFDCGLFEDSDQMFGSFSGIGAGYVMQRRAPATLLDPVRVERGGQGDEGEQLHQSIRRYFSSLFEPASPPPAKSSAIHLTQREHEILALLCRGLQYKEIAAQLDISIHTVQTHIRQLFDKLQVRSRTEAVVKFLRFPGLFHGPSHPPSGV